MGVCTAISEADAVQAKRKFIACCVFCLHQILLRVVSLGLMVCQGVPIPLSCTIPWYIDALDEVFKNKYRRLGSIELICKSTFVHK